MKQKRRASGAEALFLAAIAYALTGILVRAVSPMWGDKAQVAARFILVLVLLGGYSLLRKSKATIPKAKLPIALGLGLTFAAMVLFFTVAIGKTTIANVLFVFYASNMVASFIVGTLFLKENVSRYKLLALAFALAGLTLYSGAIEQGNAGIILALFAGLLTLFSGDEIIRTASWHGTLLMILFALVIIVGSNLLLYGFQHFDVNIGSVIMSSELIFAAVMAYWLFHEVPAAHELLGGGLVFAGSVIGSGVFERGEKSAKQIAQPD